MISMHDGGHVLLRLSAAALLTVPTTAPKAAATAPAMATGYSS